MSAFFGKVKDLWLRCMQTRWRFLVYAVLTTLFLYVTYFIFIFKDAPTLSGLQGSYWTPRQIAFRIYLGVLAAGTIVFGIVNWCRVKMTDRKAFFIIFVLAGLMIMGYSYATPIWDFGTVFNQHDIYYGAYGTSVALVDGTMDAGGGHFGLTLTFYRYWKIPQLRWIESEQTYDFSFAILCRYHPKTHYLISAIVMRINDLFVHAAPGKMPFVFEMTYQEWASMESLRIFYVGVELLQMFVVYKLLRRLKMKKMTTLIIFSVFSFIPLWCFFANWVGNDSLSCFFAFVAIYFALAYLQEGRTHQALLCALMIGLSMSCKLSGFLCAIIIAPMLIFKLVRDLRTNTEQKWYVKPGMITIYQMIGFALIVFPIGLFWPMYNLIKFGQPLNFFSETGNKSLDITRPLWWSLLVYPNDESFTSIWVYHYINDTMVQDYSLWTNAFKKAIFNEYRFLTSDTMCSALYVACMALYFVGVILVIYRLITMKKDKWLQNPYRLYLCLALLIVNAAWTMYFVARTPQTCNCDLRYFPTFALGYAMVFGIGYDAVSESKGRFGALLKNGTLVAVGLQGLMATATYISLFPASYTGPFKI